ncbi:MAG: hypothetical protein HZA77_15455 [Candidatus Schekmanbacteria bacterium]|nr:hypothetical protein [Candidatus Schekmanbacteria bacterium]
MKKLSWQVIAGISLLLLSIITYLIDYAIFGNAHDIFFYLILDIGFVPIQVLLITLIIQRLLETREKQARLEKLNMVIGAFFSEVGTRLLTSFSDYDPSLDKIRKELMVNNNWDAGAFTNVTMRLKSYNYTIDIRKVHLPELRTFLVAKRNFLLGLLENSSLLEHESFTDQLWAVFHLTEELENRTDFSNLPESDLEHIAGDIKRAYALLVHEWLAYMQHMKDNYPYLFSLAMRTNPFDQNASAIVT